MVVALALAGVVAVGLAMGPLGGGGDTDSTRTGQNQPVVVEGRAEIGRPAPRVELPTFDGGRFNLAELEGRPVVINFWASWCEPCVEEMPGFEQAHDALGDRVEFIGVNQRDTVDDANELARRTGVTYRLAADPEGRAFAAFGGLGMPTTAFIKADGTVADVLTGPVDAESLTALIETLLLADS